MLTNIGYIIEVEDDGHGMTPHEANEHFLWVGKDRRQDPTQGSRSRHKRRPVMGRKGIGKLAPFGICKIIEVISAGGDQTDEGYIVSHFIMDYDQILQHDDTPVDIMRGDLDQSYRKKSGTTVQLKNFLPKRVPDKDTFHRQLAIRFGIRQQNFRIEVEDNRNPSDNPPFEIGSYQIPLMENTRVDLSNYPVRLSETIDLPIHGWMGLAKEAYRNEEMAGVRLYARGKIVATTRDFEKPAGYTGEFTLRSYLVGEIHAEWLDADDDDDLITTDRQDILWESEYGRALREWGAERIKAIGSASRRPRRERVERLFLELAELEAKAKERFADDEVISTAVELAKQIGRFAAEDELKDQDYVDGLTEVILSVAPHKALMQAFQEFRRIALGNEGDLAQLLDLFSKTRIAEMASYAQIADERVTAIRHLESVIQNNADESALQGIIASAPWLIEATWTPITVNQGLKQFVTQFKNYYSKHFCKNIDLAIDHENKRPDFTLIQMGQKLHIVEIKAVNHTFNNQDWDRLHNYLEAFHDFFAENTELSNIYQNQWRVDLVCDDVKITDRDKNNSYEFWKNRNRIEQITWGDFLARAARANEEFLDIQDRVRRKAQSIQAKREQ